MRVDYLIVGQGVAGSLLSYFLLQAGKSVLVVDDGHKHAASITSLGLINPVIGLRLNKAWRAETLLPFARQTYRELEQKFNTKFYRDLNSLRLFIDDKQQKRWQKKKDAPELQPYIGSDIEGEPCKGQIANPHGGVEITGSASIDTAVFVDAFRAYLIGQNALRAGSFSCDDMQIEADCVHWQDVEAGKVIFCDGWQITLNRYFDWLPMSPDKGESIDIEIPGLGLDKILNRGFFMAPAGGDHYRLGATHNHSTFDNVPTDAGKAELLKKIEGIVPKPARVLAHQAGVRPSSPDRKPILGLHPQHLQLGVFNGLGSKGYSQAPYFASQFADFLLGTGELDAEVRINRFQIDSAQFH